LIGWEKKGFFVWKTKLPPAQSCKGRRMPERKKKKKRPSSGGEKFLV